jgi:hypothetical protein
VLFLFSLHVGCGLGLEFQSVTSAVSVIACHAASVPRTAHALHEFRCRAAWPGDNAKNTAIGDSIAVPRVHWRSRQRHVFSLSRTVCNGDRTLYKVQDMELQRTRPLTQSCEYVETSDGVCYVVDDILPGPYGARQLLVRRVCASVEREASILDVDERSVKEVSSYYVFGVE